MKTFAKYLLLIVAGCAMGGLFTGLDARHHFIPQRLLLRIVRALRIAPKIVLPVLDRANALQPVRVEVEPAVNLLLDPEDFLGREILVTGVWQPLVWRSISEGLSAGAVFFDVGAHIGYDSLRASVKVGAAGKVVSFEPNPATLEQLRENIAASHATNVIVEPIACTDKEQTVTLYDAASVGNSAASSLSLANADQDGRGGLPSHTVRGRTIDDVVEELGLNRLDVIKADVEGAEVLVIRGARKTLRRFHPKVVMEVVPHHLAALNTTVEDLMSIMAESGYGAAKQVDETDWEWTVK